MAKIRVKVVMDLKVSDELLSRIKNKDEFYDFIISNAFRNNSRWLKKYKYRKLRK